MKISISISIIILMFLGLEKQSFAFNDQLRDDNHTRTNEQSNVNNLKNNTDGKKELIMPVNSSEKIDDPSVTGEFDARTRSRLKRCRYTRIAEKSKRAALKNDRDELSFVSKSNSAESVKKPHRKQQVHKASVQRAMRLRNHPHDLRTTDPDDEHFIRQRVILQPRPDDSIILIGKESIKSTNETPTKYLCYCIEHDQETKKSPRKSFAPDVSPRRKTRPNVPVNSENRYDSDTVSKEYSSSKISMDDSANSERLSKKTNSQQRPQRTLGKKPRLSATLKKDHTSYDQASYRVYQPILIRRNFIDGLPHSSSLRIAHDDNLLGEPDTASKETASQLFKEHGTYLGNEHATLAEQTPKKSDDCVKLYGLENCIRSSKTSDQYEHAGNRKKTEHPRNVYQQEESDYTTTEPSRSKTASWYSTNINGDNVNTLQDAEEYSLDRVLKQHPMDVSQDIADNHPTQSVSNKKVYDSSTTKNKVVASNERQAATKDYNEHDYIDPPIAQSDSTDGTDYSEIFEGSEEKTSDQYEHAGNHEKFEAPINVVFQQDENDYETTELPRSKTASWFSTNINSDNVNSFQNAEEYSLDRVRKQHPIDSFEDVADNHPTYFVNDKNVYHSSTTENNVVTSNERRAAMKDYNEYDYIDPPIAQSDLTDGTDYSEIFEGSKEKTSDQYKHAGNHEKFEAPINVVFQQEENDYETTELPRSKTASWYFTNINGDNVNSFQNAEKYSLDRVRKQHPMDSFEGVADNHPTHFVNGKNVYHSSTTENNVVTSNERQAAKKDYDEYNHVNPIAQSDWKDRTDNWGISKGSKEKDISTTIWDECLPEYPRLLIKPQNLLPANKPMENHYETAMEKPTKENLSTENILQGNYVYNPINEMLGQRQEKLDIPLGSRRLDKFYSKYEEALSNKHSKKYIESLLRISGIEFEEPKSPTVQKTTNKTIENSLRNTGIHDDKSVTGHSLQKKPPRPESSQAEAPNQLSRDLGENFFENESWKEKNTFVGDKKKYEESEESFVRTAEEIKQTFSPKSTTWTIIANDSKPTDEIMNHTLVIDSNENIPEEINNTYQSVKRFAGSADVPTDQTEKSTLTYDSKSESEEEKRIPIKYYSPADRILAYRKKIQALKSDENDSSSISLASTDFPPVTEVPLKFKNLSETYSKQKSTLPSDKSHDLNDKSRIHTRLNENTIISLSSVDNDHRTADLFDKNEQSTSENSLERVKVDENTYSSISEAEKFSHAGLTDHYITVSPGGSENQEWTEKLLDVTEKSGTSKSTNFQRTFYSKLYKRSDELTTAKSNHDANSSTNENVNQELVGIVNFGNIRPEVSSPDYEKTAGRNGHEPETTRIHEKAAFIKNIMNLKELSEKSPVEVPSEISIPNERVSSHRDENINYDAASSASFNQLNYETSKYDPTYFGKIILNPVKNTNSHLGNSDLLYIGDNVNIPLTIMKMSDGSWRLSISEKNCGNFVKRECPCCGINENDVVEKKKRSNEASNEKYDKKSLNSKKHVEDIKNEENHVESSNKELRSTILKNVDRMKASGSGKDEFTKRHDFDELDQENLEQDENRWKNYDDYDQMSNEIAKYGYQRNNQRPYVYQRNIDHQARKSVDTMTRLLHKLKNVFLEFAPNDNT